MLVVDFSEESGIYFQIIGNYFVLACGTNDHIRNLKKVIKQQVKQGYLTKPVNWQPIDDFIEQNKDQFGKNEDYEQVVNDMPNNEWYEVFIAQALIKQRKGLVPLSKSENGYIRAMVASSGYRLDYLLNDSDYCVRVEVAKQGHGLRYLVKDPSNQVREAVAEQGFGLEVLHKDKATDVRVAVAKQGYQLDVMVLDKSPYVRAEVARQGFFINQLSNDKSPIVKRAVAEYKACE